VGQVLAAGGDSGLVDAPQVVEWAWSITAAKEEALVNLVQLTPQGVAEVSQEALRRVEHARGMAKAVFAGSVLASRPADPSRVSRRRRRG
jgi:hypothetical protein